MFNNYNKKNLIISIAACLIFLFIDSFMLKEKELKAQDNISEEIPIEGVWTIYYKIKDISKLLYLKKEPDCYTFCMDISMKEEKALIYFYTEAKPYEVKIRKIKTNEYEFINKKRKLGFVISKRIDMKPTEVGFPAKIYIYGY